METMETFFYAIASELLDTNLFNRKSDTKVDRTGGFTYSTTRCEASFYVDLNYKKEKDAETNSRKVLSEIVKLIKVHEFEVWETSAIQRCRNYTIRGFAQETIGTGLWDFDRIVLRKQHQGGSIFLKFVGLEVCYKAKGLDDWVKQYGRKF